MRRSVLKAEASGAPIQLCIYVPVRSSSRGAESCPSCAHTCPFHRLCAQRALPPTSAQAATVAAMSSSGAG